MDYEPEVIIDAGANIGLATVFFKTHYPKSTVVAIEPDEENCKMFMLNTSGYVKVHLLRGGIWPDADRCLRINNTKGESWSFHCEPADTGMPTFTVADICARFSLSTIDIMKIDIEGNERELFSRNTEWLNITDNIFIELHDYFSPGASQNVIRAIAEQNFSVGFSGENLVLFKKHRRRLSS
jgi:FkbM family methyltransferase